MVDPSGNIGTGNGWINNTLTSKGFIINPNPLSTSSSSSSSSSTPSPASSSSSSQTTSISTNSPSASSSNGSNAAAANASSDSGSTGGVGLDVGLGLGIPLLIILAVGCTWWLIRRRWKRPDDGIAAGAGYGKMQLASMSSQNHPFEYSSELSELHGGGRLYEPAEMPASGKQHSSSTVVSS